MPEVRAAIGLGLTCVVFALLLRVDEGDQDEGARCPLVSVGLPHAGHVVALGVLF